MKLINFLIEVYGFLLSTYNNLITTWLYYIYKITLLVSTNNVLKVLKEQLLRNWLVFLYKTL